MVKELFERRPFAIAVVHLPNLRRVAVDRDVDGLLSYVEREVEILSEAGFDGIILENFSDRPYAKAVRDPEILGLVFLALYTARKRFSGFVGLSLLRCSAIEAYRIAYASGAHFIRVNTLVETIATDSGVIEPVAPDLASLRMFMPGVAVFADILCKHSGSLDLLLRFANVLATSVGHVAWGDALREAIREIVSDAVERGGADAIIVTGGRTGEPPRVDFVKMVRECSSKPVIIGSGMTPENVEKYLRHADGIIVGTYIKKGAKAGNPTDPERAKRFAEKIKSLRTSRT